MKVGWIDIVILHLTSADSKKVMLRLIVALQNLPAADLLPSPSGRGTLFDDLSKFNSVVHSDHHVIISVFPLLEKVIEAAVDEDIWQAVSTLVASRATPPMVSNKATFDTPLKSTSSSYQGSEQTHKEIDPRILQEIDGCVYQNIKGFYKKYFEEKSWSATVEKIVRAADPQIMDGRWTEYPNPPSQKAFLDWFWTFQDRFLQEARGVHETSHSTPLPCSDWKRQPDLFLRASHISKHDGKPN